jgi:peptidoglycan hydrolase-like protein with peptidoglycan-binding domain
MLSKEKNMAEILIEGSRGEEVRRLQRNLNVALGKRTIILDGQNILPLETQTGIFGKRTKAAVEQFQRDYKLKKVDGKVGDETRNALAMRVLIISGTISRNANPSPSPGPQPPVVVVPKPVVPTPVVPPPVPANKNWLFQAQPALGLTPPPFFTTGSSGSSVLTGQITFGLVYRTASEGPHWEFGGAFQPGFNSRNQPTDPRYTLQLQGSVTFADPYSHGRFHTALFGQVAVLMNLAPGSLGAGAQVGAQFSLDIIQDRWNIFSQAGVAGQWTLCDQSGGSAGQLLFGPAFTILGTTIQWDIP